MAFIIHILFLRRKIEVGFLIPAAIQSGHVTAAKLHIHEIVPGMPLLLKHAFNERPAKLKSYPLPCFDQVPKHTLFTEIRQLFPMKDHYTST